MGCQRLPTANPYVCLYFLTVPVAKHNHLLALAKQLDCVYLQKPLATDELPDLRGSLPQSMPFLAMSLSQVEQVRQAIDHTI